jgi:DNA-binding NarL/FixJ family response regulator
VKDGLVQVVVADDHIALLAVFTGMPQREFSVVGTAKNGQEALAVVGELHPDVVVLDIEMPVMDGLLAARRLLASDSAARIVFLTAFADPDYVAAALNLGVAGYVLKSRAALDLSHAIRSAMLGQSFVSPGALA